MPTNNSAYPIFSLGKPWTDNANPIWLASTVCLMRNIEKYKFPGKLGSDRKKQIISLVTKDLLSMEGLINPYLIKGEDLSHVDKEFLIEHFLSSQPLSQAHSGEGFFVDETGEFITSLNLRDHLHLQLVDCKGELENTWSRLVKIETILGKSLNYSYQTKFGFLTSDPTECGTGLSVTVYLQVPGLIHTGKIDEVLEKYEDESLAITGIQGNPTEIVGDVLMVKNNYTLGITEENIISSLRTFTTKLMLEEHSARNHIKQSDDIEFKDKVSRAFGILIHSYQIEAVEALNALSLLKFGIEANWVVGIDNKQINQLFFNCHRAHLLCQYKDKIHKEDIPHKRSEYIHKALKDVHLAV